MPAARNNLLVLDEENVKYAFEREMGHLSAIFIKIRFSQPRLSNHNLDKAITYICDGRPMILYGQEPHSWFNLDYKFHYLIAHPGCIYIKIPFLFNEFPGIVKKLEAIIQNQNQVRDELGMRLINIFDPETEIIALRDDLLHAQINGNYQNGNYQNEWLVRAHRIGLLGTFKEAVRMLENARLPTYNPLNGLSLPGLFVDLEDTLFIGGKVNDGVLLSIRIAESKGQSITLWTGGSVREWAKLCHKYQLPWRLLSKSVFRGAIVENAIDDLTKDDLEKWYGIIVRNFTPAKRASQTLNSILKNQT